MPTVSVIIPTYKHRAFVLETLSCVMAQTFTDFELIVVNDGSPDDTADVLGPLIRDGKIRYFQQPNRGQASARNRGLAEATGEFIAFLDDDDLWLPDALEWQIKLLREHPKAALVYGFCERLGVHDGWRWPGPDAPTGDVKKPFLRANWIVSPGQTLIRHQALKDVGGFDETIWGADDWDLYIRLSNWGEFVYEDRPALLYRVHATNASKDSWRMYRSSERIRHKHLGRIPSLTNFGTWVSCRRWITLQFISGCIDRAHGLTKGGHRTEALAQWLRILRCRPELLADVGVVRGILKTLASYPSSPDKPK